jgi:hypothetical protein
MISRWTSTSAAAVAFLAAGAALAQQPFIYPTKGQTPQQLEFDKGQCYTWAVQQSGYDPANPPIATPPPQPMQQDDGSQPARGLFGGALLGAGIGAISGNAGEGAAIGGLFGMVRGAGRQRQQQQQQQQQQAAAMQQRQAMQGQGLNNYQRAFRACMNGRGYNVD